VELEPDQRLSGTHVLIVEDEYFIADDLARVLRLCGATPVGPAGTLEHAHDLIDRVRVDAAFLDLNLHGDMAYQLAERLSGAQVPCVILSGYAENMLPSSVKGMARLEKPVDPALAMSCLSDEIARVRSAANPS
jgi:two-component SAPR family response regulator